jgi:SAM-dependent MidA family methyltransferase
MADMLRAAGTLPGFREAIRVHLIETSPALKARQGEALDGQGAVWHETIDTLPAGPAIVIANEFFDALPVEQYVFRADGWHERMVTCRDAFAFTDGPQMSERRMAELGAPEAKLGEVFEVNVAGRRLAQALGRRFAEQPGVLLAIDYGYDNSAVGDTLQAVRRHQPVPALQNPGEADLTAHVDFSALARAGAPAKASPIVGQGSFLRKLGIELRAERLASSHPERADDLLAGCHRLINPGGMGTLFRVLALSSPDLPDLPGFA